MNPIADALVATHKELEERTKSGLARASATGAEYLGKMKGDEVVSASARLRDLATAAARVFGWDNDKGGAVTLNQVVVSMEQLEQIRALRAS